MDKMEEEGKEISEKEQNKGICLTILLKFKKYTVTFDGNYNYMLTWKQRKEDKRDRREYYVSLETAIYGLYKRSIMDNIKNKKKYEPNLRELKQAIEETKKEFEDILVTKIPIREK